MKYLKLGKTDITISRITHGCMELGGGPWDVKSKEENIKLLNLAFDNGITSFDTAEIYGNGNSEKIVGEALRAKRNDVVIASKVAFENLHAKDVRKACENSLKRLGTDYIDLLYVHWPNSQIPIEETMGEFNRLKKDGLIRAIGVSNFSVKQIEEAMQFAQIDALQPEYNLLERTIEDDVLPFCEHNNISVLSYNSIAKGILSGIFHFNGVQLAEDDFRQKKFLFYKKNLERATPLLNKLKEASQEYDATISQIATSWILSQKGMSSAIIGTQNHKHFIENIKAVDIELSKKHISEIDIISKDVLAAIEK